MPPTRTRPPHPAQLLVASPNHGAGLELLQLAERRGYTVRRAHSGAQALEQSRAAPPDLLVLEASLPDMDVFAASRALRDDPHVGPATPLLVISLTRPSSPQHHAALRAGVWEFLYHPFNAEEITAKLDSYVLLKLDSDRARRDSSVAASFHATTVYAPGGTFSSRYDPSGSATEKYRCANTRMNALMCEWMSQNTRTMPGRSNRTAFECPTA